MTEEDLIGKNLIELQSMMMPPSEPPSVSLWPETEVWTWLGFAVGALAVYAIVRLYRQRRANAYRRAAVMALSTAGEDAAAIAEILRRAALVAYPRRMVAALHGEDWLRFLDRTRGRKGFESDLGRAMLRAPYRDSSQGNEGLNDLATDWVRHHSVEVLG